MISFWRTRPPPPIEFAWPERFSVAETLRHLGDGFDVMTAALVNGEDIDVPATAKGFWRVPVEAITPALTADSFVGARDGHRLVLNTHVYPGYLRYSLNLMMPGGLLLHELEQFRDARGCDGATFDRGGHLYGEWCTRPGPGSHPVYIELRQDAFEGEARMLRVMFFHSVRRPR